jgi:hypothetical protein
VLFIILSISAMPDYHTSNFHLPGADYTKTEKDFNYDILNILMTIEELFPELSKYIGEMPVKISTTLNDEINIKNLKDYYDSLDTLLKNHIASHGIPPK